MTRYVFDPVRITVHAWADPVVDAVGIEPRGDNYFETFWTPIVGPSTVLLVRRLALALAVSPDGLDLDVAELGASLGLQGGVGRNSPVMRTLDRACGFKLARQIDATTIEVRRKVPPLTRVQVARLPEPMQRAHTRWQAAQIGHPSAHGVSWHDTLLADTARPDGRVERHEAPVAATLRLASAVTPAPLPARRPLPRREPLDAA